MVDGIAGKGRLKLHQALHGYAEGHRQLACSMPLKPRDAKAMLVLSDTSGSGVRIDAEGYLTGYPLAEAGVYALARTWPAPEMSRPGCVWTHSLLIDFAELAALDSLTELLSAFRRPQPDSYSEYGKPIEVDCSMTPPRIDEADTLSVRKIIGTLYGKPKARIISSRPESSDIDALVTVLWSQQWPRLRRAFRFCTFAATDRSTESASFDLQLLPRGNQAIRTRFPKAVEADSVSAGGDWLDEAITDLVQPRTDGLRHFLRRIGGDVAGGRAAFPALCRLYRLIEGFASEPDALGEAVALVQDEFGAAQARTARTIVALAALPQAERLSEIEFSYLLDHLDFLESAALESGSGTLGRALLRRRPAALRSMLEADGARRAIAEGALLSAKQPELLSAIRLAPELARPVLQRRPDLATDPAAWSQELAIEADAFDVLKQAEQRQPILLAMMTAGRTDLADRAAREVDSLDVLLALSIGLRSERLPQGDGERWLRAIAQPNTVARLFASPEAQPRKLLVLVARVLGPDDILNDYGEDPWLTAIRRADGNVPEPDETHLRAFLLARSLGWRSRNQAELAQFGFEHMHAAAAVNRVPDESWRSLDPRLPRSMFWFDWDRCQRLRAGVVNLFVDRQLAPEVFGYLVKDNHLFGLVAEHAAGTSSGRSYLKHVRRVLMGASEGAYTARRRYIERFVK